ncbi:hypothetical protein [Kushneria phosphatilytica]|nr:hypothetical protein [Kushneria phosphatilytica]
MAIEAKSVLKALGSEFRDLPVFVERLNDYVGIDRIRYPFPNKNGGVDG